MKEVSKIEKEAYIWFNRGYALVHKCSRVLEALRFVLDWFTSGVQIVLFLALIPIVPLPLIWLMLTYPPLGAVLAFVFVFVFACVTMSRQKPS